MTAHAPPAWPAWIDRDLRVPLRWQAGEFTPPRQPTAAEIRQYLDDAGMVAFGTHQFGVGNLDPLTGNLTAAGETALEEYQAMWVRRIMELLRDLPEED